MTLEFTELPARTVVRTQKTNPEIVKIAEALKERAGEWARLAVKTSKIGGFYQLKKLGVKLTLRNAGVEEFEKDGEVRERRLYDVYAMFPKPEESGSKGKK